LPKLPCPAGTSGVRHSKEHAFHGFFPAFLPNLALVIMLYKNNNCVKPTIKATK